MMYVLLLCTHVMSGNVCLTQEFVNAEACKQFYEAAMSSGKVDFTFAQCMPKGRGERLL